MRRLVSNAETVTHLVKVNRIARVMSGLRAYGPCRVLYMPERLGLVQSAFESLTSLNCKESFQKGLDVQPVGITPKGIPNDTLETARIMRESGCRLLITFGGDGTNRLVAMESGNVPLLPIAAGTNNFFPLDCEATKIGLAAAIFLKILQVDAEKKCAGFPQDLVLKQKLLLAETDSWSEKALIDLAISRQVTLGGRAVWDSDTLQAVFVTRCSPGASGLCGIPGAAIDISAHDPYGAAAFLGNNFSVQAVLTAGTVQNVGLKSVDRLEMNQICSVEVTEGTLLADGERVRELRNQKVHIKLQNTGPIVLDIEATLNEGLKQGYLKTG